MVNITTNTGGGFTIGGNTYPSNCVQVLATATTIKLFNVKTGGLILDTQAISNVQVNGSTYGSISQLLEALTSLIISSGGGGGGGVTQMGSFDSGGQDSAGAIISGSTLYMQSADQNYPGLINNATQYLSGYKLFQDGGIFNKNLGQQVVGGISDGDTIDMLNNIYQIDSGAASPTNVTLDMTDAVDGVYYFKTFEAFAPIILTPNSGVTIDGEGSYTIEAVDYAYVVMYYNSDGFLRVVGSSNTKESFTMMANMRDSVGDDTSETLMFTIDNVSDALGATGKKVVLEFVGVLSNNVGANTNFRVYGGGVDFDIWDITHTVNQEFYKLQILAQCTAAGKYTLAINFISAAGNHTSSLEKKTADFNVEDFIRIFSTSDGANYNTLISGYCYKINR